MSWAVVFTKRAKKNIGLLRPLERKKLYALTLDLQQTGPVRGDWPNYSKLADGSHHCHLSRSWVACLRETVKGLEIEVYYVGSREKAPY